MVRVTGPADHRPVTDAFLSTLDSARTANSRDDPNYYVHDPRALISSSTVHGVIFGTGSAVYKCITPILESTNHELILVTCFWAHSQSLNTVKSILRTLSAKGDRSGQRIRIRLCFSSLSLFQKLFHNQTGAGQTYPSNVWEKKLGLPPPEALTGIDLEVKSIFILPFSVMHPKFMIIDRKVVVLPSCNISWEEWFEGAIAVSGPIVGQFMQFYSSFWDRRKLIPLEPINSDPTSGFSETATRFDSQYGLATSNMAGSGGDNTGNDIPTIFLPSPHRRNPRLMPFASSERVIAPPTPLNAFVLNLFEKAERTIRIQTPNVTSPPVLSALLRSLARGIDVTILTSEKLMVLEQLVTAGTTTSRCVKKLINRYQNLPNHKFSRSATDEEAAISIPRPGHLRISYFSPQNGPKPRGQEEGEPQQSHLKMTIVDDEVVVLGSGNMDRASWFTSQELGVAFFDKTLVASIAILVDDAMKLRSELVFDSRGER